MGAGRNGSLWGSPSPLSLHGHAGEERQRTAALSSPRASFPAAPSHRCARATMFHRRHRRPRGARAVVVVSRLRAGCQGHTGGPGGGGWLVVGGMNGWMSQGVLLWASSPGGFRALKWQLSAPNLAARAARWHHASFSLSRGYSALSVRVCVCVCGLDASEGPVDIRHCSQIYLHRWGMPNILYFKILSKQLYRLTKEVLRIIKYLSKHYFHFSCP